MGLLFTSCGGVAIKDYQFCSPIPGHLGATCDNLLTDNQVILTEMEWVFLQQKWGTIECTQSQTVGDIKAEIEKLCSKTPCDENTKQAILGLKKILELSRMQ